MARKGENIYHRKDGRWEGRYIKVRENGKAKYGYVFARTYSAAKKKLQEARTEWKTICARGEWEKTTLRAISGRWLEDAKTFCKESTVAKYRDFLHCYILPQLGSTQLDNLSTERLQDFLSTSLFSGGADGQGLSTRTVSEILCILKGIRKYALNQGYAVGFFTDSLTLKQKKKEPRIFNEWETKRLRSYLLEHRTECNLGILLCLETGLRLGEICALRWSDISFDERKLIVRRTAQRIRCEAGSTGAKTKIVVTSPKSDSSNRAIPLPDSLCSFLASFRKGKGFLLTGCEHIMEPRSLQRRFKRVLKDSGIQDANFHALRHTFATRGVAAGFDVKCLSAILGHSNVAMTLSRYVHPTLEMKRCNMAKMR